LNQNRVLKTILTVVITLGFGYFFSRIFSGQIILPQTIRIGIIVIHYYGIIMALAVGCAYYFARFRAEKFGISRESTEDIIFWIIVGGFIGARIYHVLSSFGYYQTHPVEIFQVWHGGLSIYGALIGGFVSLAITRKILNFNLSSVASAKEGFLILNLLDWLAPSVVLGQIIGRLSNLFNYELYGYPINLPWKMFVPEPFRLPGYESFSFFHPLFLYEIIGNVFILLVLLKIGKSHTPGRVALTYLLLYNMLRFFLEFLRIDSPFVLGFRQNAAVSLIIVVIAGISLYAINRKHVQVP